MWVQMAHDIAKGEHDRLQPRLSSLGCVSHADGSRCGAGVSYLHGLSPPIIQCAPNLSRRSEIPFPTWLTPPPPLPALHSRDLKPMNCMVNRNWRVRVADFAMAGRAHIEEDEDGDGVTSQDPTSETQAAYMCPEMLRVATAKSSRHLGALHCTGRCYGQPFLC